MEHYERKIELFFELKGTPESSRKSYRRRMHSFLKYIQEKDITIEEVTDEDAQQYILHLKNVRGLSPGTINNYISSVRFFYTYVLDREWNSRKVPRMRRPVKFPVIPPREDILKMLDETTNLKHKAFFVLIYGSGLRVSEVAKLKIKDICSRTMRIRVEKAKHNTNRYTILSETALQILRLYFKSYFANIPYTKEDWLFPGQDKKDLLVLKQ
ncbi:tyrosine-type recombinase/integrase [Evansella tamaricis]|uniref:Phage integrase N-terminal SAM-like domain-containing protein n=1 Tax=Evansella tamaricis TaxID=2069301 RepID=A0ABS6JBF2_9BACI|nr:phage integrase N-terminal SAM-like domain-containing protein [Evansella tamaricis]MBU9710514.1 phage integrase N-terminal SAM-like domain-containing protein [Evansella tamaricis]